MRLGHGRHPLDGPSDPCRQNNFDLLRFVAASRERGPRLGAFTHKRALRILPAYVTVITLVALLLGPMVLSLWCAGALMRRAA